jgi:hypothetical protein
MKKTKKAAEKKPEKRIRTIWKIREVSDDGLLKMVKEGGYGGQSNVFDEYSGYASPEMAAKAIIEKRNEQEWVFGINFSSLVAIPFFEIYTEQEADE